MRRLNEAGPADGRVSQDARSGGRPYDLDPAASSGQRGQA